jgi:hypothetical protein
MGNVNTFIKKFKKGSFILRMVHLTFCVKNNKTSFLNGLDLVVVALLKKLFTPKFILAYK